MKISHLFATLAVATVATVSHADDFSFDRPGTGFGTGITPVGKVAWEQGLPTASYTEEGGVKTWTLNTDTQLRTGLGNGYELQVGFNGYTWQQTEQDGVKSDVEGLGDSFVAVKKDIDLKDDKLAWALLAQVNFATGNDEFTAENDSYSLGSTLEYQMNDDISTALTMNYSFEDGADWTVQIVPTLGYQFTEKLGGYSEFVYNKTESQKDTKSLATGLIYSFNDRFQMDASIGLDLNVPAQRSYNGGLGFSVMF
ncbi:MAG: transporter [Acinetobacter sp.]|nr:transporter [Acinetobacter sp.]